MNDEMIDESSFVCYYILVFFFFFFSSRRRHTRFDCDWSSDVCSSDLDAQLLQLMKLELTPEQVTKLRSVLHYNGLPIDARRDRKSTRLNSSHSQISYAVFCLKKKKKNMSQTLQNKNMTLSGKRSQPRH